MPDARFFEKKGPFSLAQIVEETGCRIENFDGKPDDIFFEDFVSLQEAGSSHLSFITNRKYSDDFRSSKAGACFMSEEMVSSAPDGMIALVSTNPHKAYAQAALLFYPEETSSPNIHATAIIDPSATVGNECFIGPHVVIGAGVEIGDGCSIGSGSYIHDKVVMGQNCTIHPHVSISHTVMGDNVTIYPGARLGQRGFGYAMDQHGHTPVPQLGKVVIGNHVEIGSNTTIDRGSLKDTTIGDECVIDNLVQIAHNVELGRGCVIVSQTGISGSTVLEDYVVTAGQVGLGGHIRIGKGTKLGGQSGVMADIPAGQEYLGAPAVPVRQFFKQVVALQRLATGTKKKKEA